MDSKVILAVVLSILTLVAYQYLVPGPPPAQEPTTVKRQIQSGGEARTPAPPIPLPQKPEAPPVNASSARDIVISTDLYDATFTEFGGRLKSLRLKRYKESMEKGAQPKELISTDQLQELPFGISVSGVPVPPLGSVLFKADRYRIDLDGEDQAAVSLVYVSPEGWQFTRKYTFYPHTYKVTLEEVILNATAQPVRAAVAIDLMNHHDGKADSYSFDGPAAYVNGELKEVQMEDLKEPQVFTGKISWLAYEDRYFIAAVLPRGTEPVSARMTKVGDTLSLASLVHPAVTIPANGEATVSYELYVGPKDLSYLKQLDSLEKSVDFGWFDIFARPLLSLLKFFDGYTHNYGIAIIVVTVLIKILFWPLTHKSYQSMKQMQKLQPKLARIREKYKDDKQKINEEVMALYKTYKINPLGGCLPMVLQIPVFFALYKVLLSAIELRHAPFMLWMDDLSAPDRLPMGFHIPYLGGLPVLTLLMGASMFVQQKMTPTAGDPTQAKIMLFLPVMFTFMFVNFPAGLVLYWLVSNVLSIGQQYYINKKAA